MTLALALPTLDRGPSYIEAVEEGLRVEDGRSRIPLEVAALETALPLHLAALNAQGGTITLPDGRTTERMPFSLLWLVDGAEFLGIFSIRYRLTAVLRQRGGHIGYMIRPRRQGQGLATAGLTLALRHASAVGLGRVLVTCADTNLASARVIEKNGGRLDAIVPDLEGNSPFRRYWIAADGKGGTPATI